MWNRFEAEEHPSVGMRGRSHPSSIVDTVFFSNLLGIKASPSVVSCMRLPLIVNGIGRHSRCALAVNSSQLPSKETSTSQKLAVL